MITSQTWAFIVIAFILTITPGQDMMLVFRSVLARGRAAGIWTSLGICSGLFVHAMLSALGLSVILVQSAAAFQVVKWLGAAYLVYLGVSSLRSALQGGEAEPLLDAPETDSTDKTVWQSYVEGLLNNVLNPKVAVFYLAFLPQFIVPEGSVAAQSMTLAAIHFVMGIAWLFSLSLFVGMLRALLTSDRTRQIIEGVAGVVLIGFGVRLALEKG